MSKPKRFAAFKKRVSANSPGMAIAVIALVVAMAGGAFAASGSLSGTQKKEVKKIAAAEAKKYAGKDGAQGPAGTPGTPGAKGDTGSQGPEGKQGPEGEEGEEGKQGLQGNPGKDGKDGEGVVVTPILEGEPGCEERGGAEVRKQASVSGPEVCNGAEGKEGKEGQPWTPNNLLPPGAMETGSWAFNGNTADTTGILVPLSFFIPLPGALSEEHVHYQGEEGFEASCPGTGAVPNAEPGELCVFENAQEPIAGTTFQEINKVNSSFGFPGANRTGAMLIFTAPTGPATGSGVFAVRAPVGP